MGRPSRVTVWVSRTSRPHQEPTPSHTHPLHTWLTSLFWTSISSWHTATQQCELGACYGHDGWKPRCIKRFTTWVVQVFNSCDCNKFKGTCTVASRRSCSAEIMSQTVLFGKYNALFASLGALVTFYATFRLLQSVVHGLKTFLVSNPLGLSTNVKHYGDWAGKLESVWAGHRLNFTSYKRIIIRS